MLTLLRLTGWSALTAAFAHLLQFLVLGIGPVLDEPEFPTPGEAASNYWFGVAGATTFTVIGLAYLVFFSAATALVWQDATGTDAAWSRAAHSATVVGVTGWFLAGMTNIARRGFNATAIDEVTTDPSVARAALQSTDVLLTTAATATAVVLCAWRFAFAVRAVKTGTLGLPTAVAVVVLGGLVPLAGWVANVGGIPSSIVALLVLGAALLLRARRLERVGAASSTPTLPVAP
ncbi:hypothetical protein SAMN06264364_12436 [Quadrisphaera granulorum]|uniref:DUF4386 family protein n=1 Tax=Quadrisphaera granulorum TaxID=317664 RepID=A0A315ZYA6_9ACTN|nr:hypothetical protein [Quadrisphaera granulorum]PWJ49870.1 hypothetical protein BXY45_12436 [Quadrisphaera granulorum]SZE98078.1 hypothetical protein SAMN06264364_12436 [Quadrisphaera granulorum]